MSWSARIIYTYTAILVVGGVSGIVYAETVPDAFAIAGLTFTFAVFGLVLGARLTDKP